MLFFISRSEIGALTCVGATAHTRVAPTLGRQPASIPNHPVGRVSGRASDKRWLVLCAGHHWHPASEKFRQSLRTVWFASCLKAGATRELGLMVQGSPLLTGGTLVALGTGLGFERLNFPLNLCVCDLLGA